MQATHDDSNPEDRIWSVGGPQARRHQELTEQYESVLAFADFCTYLTAGRVDDRAGRLVEIAHALYAETTDDRQQKGRV